MRSRAINKLRTERTRLEKGVKTQVKRIKSSKEISSWFNAFSNNILPPALFFFISTVALHYIPRATSMLLRINLGLISLASAALSLYIITLMF
ncbi:MAG: hypothetical protein ABIF92_02750 [archaeon]